MTAITARSKAASRMPCSFGAIGCVMPALLADLTIRSNHKCRRRRARALAKVGAGLGYQAARRGERARRLAFWCT